MAFKYNKTLYIFSFKKSLRTLSRGYLLPFGIFLSFNFCGEAHALPIISKAENTLPSLLSDKRPLSRDQASSPPQPQSTQEPQDDNVTSEMLSSQLAVDLQNQVSRYDALVEQAKILKQDWDNTGSLISLNRYNALIRDIQMINDSLKIMGGCTLPNLPLLTLNQAEEFSNILEEDLLETDKKALENWSSEEEKLVTPPYRKDTRPPR